MGGQIDIETGAYMLFFNNFTLDSQADAMVGWLNSSKASDGCGGKQSIVQTSLSLADCHLSANDT